MLAFDTNALINLTIPAAAAAAAVACHIFAGRTWPDTGIYRALLAGALAGLAVLALFTVFAIADGVDNGGAALANAAIYCSFCYVYFHFNNMGETARRVRLLREIGAAVPPLTYDEILKSYGAEEVLNRRLSRLLAAGQVVKSGDRLFIANRSVYFMAWAVNLAHRVVFGTHRRNPLEEQ